MEPGVGSFAFGWAAARAAPPFDETALVAFASRHRLAAVQIADNMPVHTWDSGRLERFVQLARAAGLSVELGARGLTDEHLERYLSLCGGCGARLLRFVADAHSCEPSPEDVVRLLRNAAAALEASGVTVALENHDRFPAAVLRRIVDGVGSSHVGVCLDTANSLGAGEGLDAVTDALAPVVVNLHVKDVRISRLPHLMGFIVEGTALGAGQLPIRRTLERVAEYGRCDTVILESWTPPIETDRAATIAREAADAETSIDRLKAWLTTPSSPPQSLVR